MSYQEFLNSKRFSIKNTGFTVKRENLNSMLFDFQKDIVLWALKKGKAALFEDCGLGKTPQLQEWAKLVCEYTGGNVLVVAPLAVSQQMKREAEKFGNTVTICRHHSDVQKGINITNYEMIEHFNISEFVGVVLDESSILKGYDRHYSQTLIEKCSKVPYKLSCTATPSPNDYMELGTQCEWLGVMSRTEMLATFFVHDGGDTAKWRLKGHAEDKFWEWVASWAVVLQKPSDLDYDDCDFILPGLEIIEHIVKVDTQKEQGQLNIEGYAEYARTLDERRAARNNSLDERVKKAAEICNESDGQVLVWCDLNKESELLKKSISGSVEVKGSDKSEFKEKTAVDFATSNIKYLVSKPSIFGWGLNFQSCHNMIFVGLSDSYELLYQAIRRCYRFGQKQKVNVHIVISEQEGHVKANIERKEADYRNMMTNMVQHTKKINTEEVHGTHRESIEYNPKIEMKIPKWLRGQIA